jgi:hypothetical protein
MSALRAALADFIDYAGLFPPAALDLQTTVANHDRYACSSEGWMLGRLVVPLSRLDEVAAVLARSPAPERNWQIAALAGAGDGIESALAAIGRFRASPGTAGVTVSALETVPPGVDAVPTQAGDLVTLERFVEVPLDATRDTWLDALTGVGCNAKVRTGGLTADRFPSPASLASLLAACAHRGLPLKATAGLHHAMHGAYRLTYESGSPTGLMHGFLNLLVAALILRTAAGTTADARRALEVRDPREFTLGEDAISWEGRAFTATACADTRTHLLRSVGSCSFDEPVADLRGLGWLPRDPSARVRRD